MRGMYDLKEKFCEALEELSQKRNLSSGDMEYAHMLTDTLKNIYKIEMFEEQDGGYSRDGSWEAEMRGDYSRESSYARRDSRGRYSRESSRDGGYSGRSSRDGSSQSGDKIKKQLERMEREAGSEHEREAIKRCMKELREA